MTTESDVADRARASQFHSSPALHAADDFLSREFLLVAACCRWPPSAVRDAAIRTAATGAVDWIRFLQLVQRHRVAGLVHDALSPAGIKPPSPIAENLAAQARRIARHNLFLAAETVRLQHSLETADIPALVLKGVPLAQLAYGSLKIKHARDIDLLVLPNRVEAALRILGHEGYALSYPAEYLSDTQRRAVLRYAREVILVSEGNNSPLELQWRLTNNPLLLKGVDAYSTPQSVYISEDVSVRTLAREDLFAYLCAHGAQHAWSRLKWLADVNALIATGAADSVHLYRHAQERGVGVCAGQTLLLCHRLFDLILPAALTDEIQSDSRSQRLATIAVQTMADPYAEAEAGRSLLGVTRVMLAQFLLGRGWAFYVAECRVASVRILDLIDLPLPPSLHFLYPLLRLPLWLWRRAMSAIGHKR